MLSGSITVPAYTTYAERDYEFIIDDCEPSVALGDDAISLPPTSNLPNEPVDFNEPLIKAFPPNTT